MNQIINAKLPNQIQPVTNLIIVVHQLIILPENSKELCNQVSKYQIAMIILSTYRILVQKIQSIILVNYQITNQ